MRLHDLRPAKGAKKAPKRVGRGIGSGTGKTSTRGHKGQGARSGGGVRPGFEGGQMPLQQRVPKRGFTNAMFRRVYEIVNVQDLDRFPDGTVVTPQLLKAERLAHGNKSGIKILGKGNIGKQLKVQAHAFSKSATAKIAEAGGTAELIGLAVSEVN